jgi:hypothetical protein
LATGDQPVTVVPLLAAALWLAGHCLYALRHVQYKSPLPPTEAASGFGALSREAVPATMTTVNSECVF